MPLNTENATPEIMYQLPATMDSQGRILIPASIRKTSKISPLSNIVVKQIGNTLIIEAV